MKKPYWLVFLLTLYCTWSVAFADTTSVLLIPVRTTGVASDVYMFDPFDGHYLGVFATDSVNTGIRTNVTSGPDGNIYAADFSNSAVYVHDNTGNYLYTYADASDGLIFIKGIAFRGDSLFIPNSTHVAVFDGPHSRLPDFIPDVTNPHEIFFLEDGWCLVSVAGESLVRLYNADGTPSADVITTATLPQQIQADSQLPGAYLNAPYAEFGQITDFDLDGTIHNTLTNHYGGGIYRLENGNLLVTDGSGSTGGVYELTNAGDTVDVEFAGMRAYWIELCEVEIDGPTCAHVPGDSDENGIARELTDVVKMIAYYRGFDQPGYVCNCSEQNPEYKPSADVDGNCTSFELTDVVKSIAAYRGPVPLTGCEDCPGSLRLIPGQEDRPQQNATERHEGG